MSRERRTTIPQEFLEKRVHHIERRLPTKGQIDRAVALVKSRTRPIVICGGGVRYSEAGKELKEFCASFGVPFGETQAGKGVISWEDPWNLGGIGVTGGLAANRIARDADLVIAVGTRLGDFTTGSRNLFRNPNAAILSINVNAFDAAKMNAAVNRCGCAGKPAGAHRGASRRRVEIGIQGRCREGARGMAERRGSPVHAGRPGGAVPGASPGRAEREPPAEGCNRRGRLGEPPGRPSAGVAHPRARFLPHGVRLFLHGLRDRRCPGGKNGRSPPGGVRPRGGRLLRDASLRASHGHPGRDQDPYRGLRQRRIPVHRQPPDQPGNREVRKRPSRSATRQRAGSPAA